MTGTARLTPWLVAAIILALPALFGASSASYTLFNQGLIAIVLALAYNMLLGQAGMLSFGHAIYFGLAGYAVAHYLSAVQNDEALAIPVIVMPVFGGLVGLVFGLVIGFVSTRRAGTIFAMISLGFAEMVTALTLILVAFFNGEEGVQTDRAIGNDLFGLLNYDRISSVYILVAIWALIAIALMYLFTRTPLGRIANAVRDNPERVEFIGYSMQQVRWRTFAISGFFCGVAGALHAVSFEHVGFETVSVERSGLILFMAYIGGAGAFAGPILGAILVTIIDHVFGEFTKAWLLYLGLVFMIVVMFSPGGIAGALLLHERLWRAKAGLLRRLVPSYAAGIGASLVLGLGAICLVELTHTATARENVEKKLTIFWIDTVATNPIPWLVGGGLLVAGYFLCRLTYPRMKDAYGHAAVEATKRMNREPGA